MGPGGLVGEGGLLRGWKLDLELEKAKKWLLAALGFWHGTPYHQPTNMWDRGGGPVQGRSHPQAGPVS